MDDLVMALGIEAGASKSEVSRIWGELDRAVAEFRGRPLGHARFPYLFLDATYVKAHHGSRVVAKAIVVATDGTERVEREVLGLAVGDSEEGAFWTAFLRSLRARGLAGVQLVISDAHDGLKAAIGGVLLGTAWQRCRVHFPAQRAGPRAACFGGDGGGRHPRRLCQPDGSSVREQLDVIVERLEPRFPAVAAMLHEAREELTSFTAFPVAHWRKVWSTNPLERVNKEIKRAVPASRWPHRPQPRRAPW